MGGGDDPSSVQKSFEKFIASLGIRDSGNTEECKLKSVVTRHGTTVIILHNQWGVFIISDGCVYTEDFNPNTGTRQGQITSWVHKKTYILGQGQRLLITGAGDLPWVDSIIDHLIPVADLPEWTAERCANFAKFHMTSGFEPHKKYSNLTAKDMSELVGHMVFTTFENGRPSVYYADKNQVKEIVIDSRYHVDSKEWDDEFGFVGYKSVGTGRVYVNDVFLSELPEHGESLQESMLTLLKLMHVAVRWDDDTGGTIEIHHMNRAGVVRAVPPFHSSKLEDFITELGGVPYDYEPELVSPS